MNFEKLAIWASSRLFSLLIACVAAMSLLNSASAASFEEAHTAIVRQARSEINEQHLNLIRAQNTLNIDGQVQALARQAQVARKYIRGLEKLESIASGQSQKLLVLKFPRFSKPSKTRPWMRSVSWIKVIF